MKIKELLKEAAPIFTNGDITKIVLCLHAVNDGIHDEGDDVLDVIVMDKLVDFYKTTNKLPARLANLADDEADGDLVVFIMDDLDKIFQSGGVKALKNYLA